MSPARNVLLVLAALLGGCTTDQYARMLVQPDTTWGRINEAIMAPSDQLVRDPINRITAAPRFTTSDGIEIDVWVLAASTPEVAAPTRGTLLIVHGLADSKVGYLRLAQAMSKRGLHVVLVDLRAHGRSTGNTVTYGALEKHDLKGVMDALYANKTVAGPLYVFGPGMGGSIAVLYAAMDLRVRGVVAIAPDKDLESAAQRFFSAKAIFLTAEQLQDVIARAGEIGRFPASEASAVTAAAQLRAPLLVMHGGADVVVPRSDSEAILTAAAGPRELAILPMVGHVGAMFGQESVVAAAIERVIDGKIGKPPGQ